jgi:hypothetical protein
VGFSLCCYFQIFTRLQQANDKRDLSTMRDYMTPDFYSAITAQIDSMGVV